MTTFAEMFRAAAGREPEEYLALLARDGLPAGLGVPPGGAPAAVLLAWLWRAWDAADNSKMRGALDAPDHGKVPRRVIYALPQGSDLAPVVAEVRGWLDSLGLADEVALHATAGIWAQSAGLDWREDMHRPAIVVGTSEVLVSKALNRAFGVGPAIWPIDFALVTNGAHWVVADAAACPRAVATLQRIAALAREHGTAEPLRLTLMSSAQSGPEGSGDHGYVSEGSEVEPFDLVELFDTSPEAAAAWLDVAPLVAEAGRELHVGVAWATWTPVDGGGPDPEVRAPAAEYRRAMPLSAIGPLVAERPVWRRAEDGSWARVASAAEVEPFSVLLADAPERADAPVLRTPAELAALLPDDVPAQAALRPWQSLDEHSEQVRDQAAALVSALDPAVPAQARKSAVVAGYLHDAGKAHGTWQDALCALAPEADQAAVQAGRPWAKSGAGAQGRLEFAHGSRFRHELASLLLIDAPLGSLLAAAPDPDLCRYLVLAHHGQLRVRVSDWEPVASGEENGSRPGAASAEAAGLGEPQARVILGLEHGSVSDVPALLGCAASRLTVDLAPFGDGAPDGGAWAKAVAGLLAKYGPFRLAYLETLVRIADWRASGGRELPG